MPSKGVIALQNHAPFLPVPSENHCSIVTGTIEHTLADAVHKASSASRQQTVYPSTTEKRLPASRLDAFFSTLRRQRLHCIHPAAACLKRRRHTLVNAWLIQPVACSMALRNPFDQRGAETTHPEIPRNAQFITQKHSTFPIPEILANPLNALLGPHTLRAGYLHQQLQTRSTSAMWNDTSDTPLA